MLGQVHGTQAAILIGAEPLLAAGVGGLKLIEVRDGVGAVGGIQEEHTRLTVVVGLLHDLLKQVTGAQGLVFLERDASGLGLLKGALKAFGTRIGEIGVAQGPFGVVFDCLHEGICDAHRDVKVGDLVLVGLAGNELFHIRVIDTQHGHVGAAAGAALSYFAKGVIVDAQKADWAGSLAGRGLDQGALGTQAREREAVAAAGLLNEGSVAQGLEDTGRIAAHIIHNG
ncbi:hypothetical protein SDC9_167752 [bioreactor metagenome]|uniref:Uncharacterized protein n=1 Tax=bioreactor metagenome TaxID=1076179 RepID=A0A645G8Y1_9ZZZZ